jgi:replication fork clamp-binding protein CrfC
LRLQTKAKKTAWQDQQEKLYLQKVEVSLYIQYELTADPEKTVNHNVTLALLEMPKRLLSSVGSVHSGS